MGLIKEPKNVGFSTKSELWTEKELADFRKLTFKKSRTPIWKQKRLDKKEGYYLLRTTLGEL